MVEEAFSNLVKGMRRVEGWKKCQFSIDIYVTSRRDAVQDGSPQAGSRGTGKDTVGSEHSTPCSRSSSSSSIKEKSPTNLSASPDEGPSSPTSEIENRMADLPVLAQQQERKTQQTSLNHMLSDGCNGDMIKVTKLCGRPQDLTTALFGHLDEVALREDKGLTVGLCGPPSLCDDVRVQTVRLLKRGIHVELVEDCFTW